MFLSRAFANRARPLLYHVVMRPAWCTASILTLAFMLKIAAAQSTGSIWDGVYSDTQAARGAALYQTACASCHGDKLQGKGQTPALTGSEFVMNWSGMTLGDLFDKMQTSMPADKPGTFSREQNPSGMAELSSDAERLRQIRFEAAPAK